MQTALQPDPMTESSASYNSQNLDEARQYWDQAAATFDQEPDHGLRNPRVRDAWTALLRSWLPGSGAAILDAGCGTGSLSVVMAGLGHHVTGIDLSPTMIAQARAKTLAEGMSINFHVMDAAAPQFAPQSFDVILCRHLLWMFPQPAQVLARWVNLLKPGGRLIMVEGYWETGGGLHAEEVIAALPAAVSTVSVQTLCDQPDLWGKNVTDERFVVVALNNLVTAL